MSAPPGAPALAVTHGVPACLAPEGSAGAEAAVVTPGSALVISMQLAVRIGAPVRHPCEAHPRSPKRATACTAAASGPPKRWWQRSVRLSTTWHSVVPGVKAIYEHLDY
jgi:hypothetical protein